MPDGIVDKTDELIEKIKNEFLNHTVDQPITTYIDETSEHGPPWARVTTGYKIKAKGWCKAVAIGASTGTLQAIAIPGLGGTFWLANLTLEFRYESWTRGEKWVWPGGIYVGYEWENLHPKGTVKLILGMEPQRNGRLRLECMVDADHDDRPGHFIRDRVAPHFINRIDSIIENYTGVSVET